MLILGLDTAMAACSVALWQDGAVIARRMEKIARGHSEALMPMIHETMAEASVGFGDLDRIGVTVGPGSFTGLRIGLAAARGLALAAGLPLVGVTTLEAVAYSASNRNASRRSIVVALDTGRPDLFVQIFAPDLTPKTEARALGAKDAAAWAGTGNLIAGNGAALLRAAFSHDGSAASRDVVFDSGSGLPDAADVAAIAGSRDPGPLSPLYIHPPYARPPVTKSRSESGQ